MITPDPNIERATLRLRDAFRVFAWEMFKVSYNNPKNPENLNTLHSRFYWLWRQSRVSTMDFFQLENLAIEKGFSVEEFLMIRAHYYGFNSESK